MYKITRDDLLKRICFIINLTQNQTGSTMQGALTSKSDSMGGIFDRFINSISEDIIFDKIILPSINTHKNVEFIKDYYLYKPTKNGAGIAPDVFGLKIEDKIVPFVVFDEKWLAVENMPQIEVKTFKFKDQMITLRNQDYDAEYLVMVDLDLRIDYLVPFLNQNLINNFIINNMIMDDNVFIKNDSKNKISKLHNIDYSKKDIGNIDLITITKGADFLTQATLCQAKISPRRMKSISSFNSKILISAQLKLSDYVIHSERISSLYEFNNEWYLKTNIDRAKVVYLDFSANNIENIEICRINKSSIIIKALDNNCKFNETLLDIDKYYKVEFETLDRSGNDGVEHFMQKQCAKYLTNYSNDLIMTLKNIIDTN